MKCKYCNAEVAPNARFCTTCGGDLSKFYKCVNCGEYIDKGESVCPHCGTEQLNKKHEKSNGSKTMMWILGVILLLGIVGGGWYLFNGGYFGNIAMAPTEEATDSIAENDSIFEEEYDIHSLEGVKQCMTAILNKGLYMSDEDAVKAYFSNEFKDVYNKVVEYDKKTFLKENLDFGTFLFGGMAKVAWESFTLI